MNDFASTLEVGRPYKKKPWLGVLYGHAKVSKTGSAIYAPNPFIIALDPGCAWVFSNPKTAAMCQSFQKGEEGNKQLVVAKNIDETFAMIAWIANNASKLEEKPKTVIIDGIKFFEEWTIETVRREHATKDVQGNEVLPTFESLGIERYEHTRPHWDRLFAGIDRLRSRGLNVLVVGHAMLKTMTTTDEGTGQIVSYKETMLDLPMWGSLNIPNEFARKADWFYYIKSKVKIGSSGSGKWKKNVAKSDSEAATMICTRATSEYYAGSRSVNEELIPDYYEFTRDDREEVLKEMFAHLEA